MIIWLNGTSSSGKTCIAKKLQDKLEKRFLLVQIDIFINMYPQKLLESEMNFMRILDKEMTAFHYSIDTYHRKKLNLIVDQLLVLPEWKKECQKLFKSQDVLFVGLFCPLKVLGEREKNRKNRMNGLAKRQIDRIHKDLIYDLELKTNILSVDECVNKIIECINKKNYKGIRYIR